MVCDGRFDRVAWIHVGTPNVGARALFAQLAKHDAALARHGVVLPRSGRAGGEHRNLVHELTGARAFDPRLGTLASLRHELAASRAEQAVLVCEELCAVPEAAGPLAEAVRRGGFQPRAVIGVRPQAEAIELGYAALAVTVVLDEDYRFGPMPRFADFLREIEATGRFVRPSGTLPLDYAALADALRGPFGEHGVLVRVAGDPGDDLAPLRSFAALLGGGARDALERLAALEPRTGRVVTYGDVLHALRVDATGDDELQASLRLAGDEPFRALTTAELERVAARFAAPNERLARHGEPLLDAVPAARRAEAERTGPDADALAAARRVLQRRARAAVPGTPPRYRGPHAVLHGRTRRRTRGTVFIHAGTHKTGTTALQRFLGANERALLESGLHYPRQGRVEWGHHNLAWELYAPELFNPGRGSLDDVAAELRAAGAPRACSGSPGSPTRCAARATSRASCCSCGRRPTTSSRSTRRSRSWSRSSTASPTARRRRSSATSTASSATGRCATASPRRCSTTTASPTASPTWSGGSG
jgi:hypothetical protein